MFTLEQISTAHEAVKSGADFPAYTQAIIQLGVTAFETWVTDSHTTYFGREGYQVTSEPMYHPLAIATETNAEKFMDCLKIHQQGETDYLTFCSHCAETGIEKWVVDLGRLTCTYYSTTGNEVLVETIPG